MSGSSYRISNYWTFQKLGGKSPETSLIMKKPKIEVLFTEWFYIIGPVQRTLNSLSSLIFTQTLCGRQLYYVSSNEEMTFRKANWCDQETWLVNISWDLESMSLWLWIWTPFLKNGFTVSDQHLESCCSLQAQICMWSGT